MGGFVMPQNPFEIPSQLRRLAEGNVEQARRLYLQFLDGVAQAMAAWSASSTDMITPKFHQVRKRASEFAKENADAAFALAKEVSQANDLQELLSLQTRYAQSQMRWYADQTQEFNQLLVRAEAGIQDNQGPQANAGSIGSETPSKVEITKNITNLKLIGFSIEVETPPVTLLLETDKGPYSLEIPRAQLDNLVYALRFVAYAEEPLQERLRKQEEAAKGKAPRS
jgi:hypothetical protein